MSILEAFVLGLIQGAAEFLPISSSGHLVLAQALFGIEENNLAFAILLHLGTFFAIIVAYKETVWGLIREFFLMLADIFKGRGANLDESRYRRYIIYIITGCIPAGVAGVLFDEMFEELFSNVAMVCLMLILTGFVLVYAEKLSRKTTGSLEELGVGKSFIVGLFQMCAIMPGLSRSGTTMTGGLVAGLKKEDALEFSFLLALPTILGSVVLKLGDLATAIREISLAPVLVGFFTAMTVGYFSIVLFKKTVKKGSLLSFSVYCWLVAAAIILNLGRF